MDYNKRSKLLLSLGSVLVIATVLSFLLIGKESMNTKKWISFTFVLFAEIIFFSGMIMIERLADKSEQIILRAGGGSVIAAYSAVVIVISLIYMNFSNAGLKGFLIIQIILFAVALILEILFVHIAKEIMKKN
ncbi:hypothetical protein [Ruminococcus gauvreauii]|uniref:Uncharacterized protein n=1 Tax=Ruminococcus gauvreauii TaxID=438033 RepID=A0ABY5VJK6_9FIRM|nr:hypothetical protein [Ruminococcus gauvreauii]UWP60790.1 hypothetical protein NQ502_07070 [Ruminococcus gauvreauii]